MTLNLVHRMSIGMGVDAPPLNFLLEHAHADSGDLPLPINTPGAFVARASLEDLRAPATDVILVITFASGLDPRTDFVRVFLNARILVVEAFLDQKFDCSSGTPRTEEHIIPQATWLQYLQQIEDEGVGDPLEAAAFYSRGFPHGGLDCTNQFMRLDVDYKQRIIDPEQQDNRTWRIFPVTNHKTLVHKKGEPSGVPSYQTAKWAINRRTGKLVIVSECRAGDGNQATVSGFGYGPHDENGQAIPTRSLPGTFESVTTGRLRGVVAEFKTDGECPQV